MTCTWIINASKVDKAILQILDHVPTVLTVNVKQSQARHTNKI